MLYRLFTENRNYDQLKSLVCHYFDGATLITAEGIWQGNSEHSLIIEIECIYLCHNVPERIERLCYDIKKLNQQDKILVQRIESDSQLV